MSFIRQVLHMNPLLQVRYEASSSTRRDTHFDPQILRQKTTL